MDDADNLEAIVGEAEVRVLCSWEADGLPEGWTFLEPRCHESFIDDGDLPPRSYVRVTDQPAGRQLNTECRHVPGVNEVDDHRLGAWSGAHDIGSRPHIA